jgi:hypothetical protein
MAPIAISESNPIEAADAIVALKAANDTRLPVTILSGMEQLQRSLLTSKGFWVAVKQPS